MKVYQGTRGAGGLPRVRVSEHNQVRGLAPRLDLSKLSTPDFDWGRRGTEPLSLAVAMCADAIGAVNGAGGRADALAMRVAFDFLDRVVISLPHDRFEISEMDVLKEIDAIQRERGIGAVSDSIVDAGNVGVGATR
jgi:Family of unknown function (DUF6166)